MIEALGTIARARGMTVGEANHCRLGHPIARARGMTEIARESGLAREALYRALRGGAAPRFDTVMRVMQALGVRLVAEPDVRPVAHG